MKRIAVLLLALALSGCSRAVPPPPPPLLLDQWQALPADRKYAPETLQRLRDGETRFADEAEWERFLRGVVVPGKAREHPGR